MTEQLSQVSKTGRGAAIREKKSTGTKLQKSQLVQLTLKIDARELAEAHEAYPDVPFGVLWFPFPWVYRGRGLDMLLKNIITSAARIHSELNVGGVLIIGLTKDSY